MLDARAVWYAFRMIEIQVKCDPAPEALAELIASTIHGVPVKDATVVEAGKRVRAEKEREETQRRSWTDLDTVNFQTIDDDLDWSDL